MRNPRDIIVEQQRAIEKLQTLARIYVDFYIAVSTNQPERLRAVAARRVEASRMINEERILD